MIFPDSLALAQARADYERDGVACLRNIVDPIWIERLRDGTAQAREDLSEYSVDLSAAGPGEDAAATQKRAFWGDFSLWQRFDPFERFILGSPIGAVTAAAVGSERNGSGCSTTICWSRRRFPVPRRRGTRISPIIR